MILLSADQHAQLAGYTDRFKRVTLKSWKARGLDVSQYADLIKPEHRSPKKTRGIELQVSTIGDRVKEATRWTGIKECQRCSALRKKLNGLTTDQVREGIEGHSAAMLANFVALANGEAVDLMWWDRKTAQAKATVALAVMGEDSVLSRCRSLILTACEDEDRANGREASPGDPSPAESGDSTGSSSEPTPNVASLPSPPFVPEGGASEAPTGRPHRRGQTEPQSEPVPLSECVEDK